MNLSRRGLLKGLAGGLVLLARGAAPSLASGYRVGCGRQTSPYAATLQAVEACGEWPTGSLPGRTVVIKPNLVKPAMPDTGITTDPEVVRALVDLALRDGADRVLIVEHVRQESDYAACGYDVFSGYDPQGRVELVNLKDAVERLVPVPDGLAYGELYLPEVVLDPDVLFISVGKMKTHALALASLSLKNLFGLPLESRYHDARLYGRFAMHQRGVHQVILDLNIVKPIDFAVVDGVWAMEGKGPLRGDPVRMDTVVAGRNAVAVDRICLLLMGVPQWAVQYLTYASRRSMGPRDLEEIQILGDPPPPRKFLLPPVPPGIGCPHVYPRTFAPGNGKVAWILYWLAPPGGPVRTRIVRGSANASELVTIRTLQDWTWSNPGMRVAQWDGRNDLGEFVAEPGWYAVQVQAKRTWSGASLYSIV